MKKLLLSGLMLGMFSFPALWAADYGLPVEIQQGNILHCFNWPAKDVKAALPQIAEAGFGSVQLSPLQRGDVNTGSPWHDLYRPYDLAFKSSGYCSEQDLKDLCEAAAEYGIKVIVDVVANHVDKTSGYHDTWWDSNGRVRWDGGIDYGNRYSITHGQLGDYGDVNSESAEVAARGKAYVEKLKELGVKGCRWDAAKHIGLPSEGCNFWSTVTSVSGMYHYGEILDAPGPDGSIVKEYCSYMSVTDNQYCNYAAKDNGGIPGGYGGAHVVDYGCPDTKMVYWAESHDTYSNDEWSMDRDQSVIDRAYAAYACRNGATALYLSRPNTRGFNNIKVGKGSTAFTSKHIAEVNKFRNLMTGRADWFESNGNACSITRDGGGAVIVMKGSGNVSIANGGGYCPAGTYTDRVSGGTFTVTASTISGNVGASGIAVLVKDGLSPVDPDPVDPIDPDPIDPDPVDPSAEHYVYYDGTFSQPQVWAWTDEVNCTASGVWGGDNMVRKDGKWYWALPAGKPVPTQIIIHMGDDKIGVGDLTYVDMATYHQDGSYSVGGTPVPPVSDAVEIVGDYNLAYSGSLTKVYYWGGASVPAWPGVEMTTVTGSDGLTYKVAKVAEGTTACLFNSNGDSDKTGDLVYTSEYVMGNTGATSKKVTFRNGGDGPVVVKPVVTASPASGTVFTDDAISVTLSVTPEATIYYSLDGTATAASTKYTAPISINATTTISTYALTAEGGESTQTFTYTKRDNSDPVPPVVTGESLNTDYYKVNPSGKTGSNRTVKMNFDGQKSTTALSNWTDADLIAQGVARDVCQAFKGVHERPVVDSYALYAAYDSENLYLGVQYVYTIWDLYGEGKQPGESKPYNMDGKLCFAFDLDPAISAAGLTNEGTSIWQGDVFTTFDNGADAWWYGSTKPGVGTPGFFVPNAQGICDYSDPNSCKVSTVKYGYADGLLPSIDAVYGQDDFSYDPALLEGNTGFIDLRDQIADSAHTFYEYTFPLSLLGVSEDYIRTNGIGVMVVDFYGASAHASLPYDPCFYDNVNEAYSQDPSSSAEKEDKDIVTYSLARVGRNISTAVDAVETAEDVAPVYYTLQGLRVDNPSAGLYIVVRGNRVSKEIIR